MSTINIEDLSQNDSLDREALRAVYGGLFGIRKKIRKLGRSARKLSRYVHKNMSGKLTQTGRIAKGARWALVPGVMAPTYLLSKRYGGRIGNRR